MSQIEKQIANSLFDSNGTSSGASDCYKIALEHMKGIIEWLPMFAYVAEDEYYYCKLSDGEQITTDQLIDKYLEHLDDNSKKRNDLFKDGKTLEDVSKKKKDSEYEDLPCYACQGGGCPVCNGFGTICQIKKNSHEQ